MTDGPPRRRRSGRPSDPFGIGARGSLLAPILAALGLGLVAVVTLALFTGSIPLPGGGSGSGSTDGGGGGGGPVGPIVTPVPSNIVIVDPRTNIPGTLVFVKQGNLWTQTGNKAVQLTTSGHGAMPTWSPDGQWIYYIESVPDSGYFPGGGNPPTTYAMEVPILTRIKPDGTGAEKLLSGRFKKGRYDWFFWIRQPDVSPDGRTVAITSDGPDPTKSDVVLQTYDVKTDKTQPPRPRRERAARPPGSGLAPGRQAPALRQERTRRGPRRPDDLPLRPGDEEDLRR